MRNFISFGITKNKKNIAYETLTGNLYDYFMLGRYFKDIYNLDKISNKKIPFKKNLIHDTKDLKFNLINFLLILKFKNKNFYEFGFTIYEKIFYFKFFKFFLQKNINLKKINFYGNEISEKFIFFCKNFYKGYNLKLFRKVKRKYLNNSVFFSKGVTLLYEKKNIQYLKYFIKYCDVGSFDISLYPEKKTILLKTGYKLYYPSINDFVKILNESNKCFFYRNKKKIRNKIYFEILFGNEKTANEINKKLHIIFKNKKNSRIKKYLFLKQRFERLKLSHFK